MASSVVSPCRDSRLRSPSPQCTNLKMKPRRCCYLPVKTVLFAIKSSFPFDKNVRKKKRRTQKLFKINLDCNVHQVKAQQEGEIENEKGKEEKE